MMPFDGDDDASIQNMARHERSEKDLVAVPSSPVYLIKGPGISEARVPDAVDGFRGMIAVLAPRSTHDGLDSSSSYAVLKLLRYRPLAACEGFSPPSTLAAQHGGTNLQRDQRVSKIFVIVGADVVFLLVSSSVPLKSANGSLTSVHAACFKSLSPVQSTFHRR